MPEYKLPPITIESIQESANEIPWGVQMVNAPTVWNETKGEGIVVCILDTGIDKDHPDLVDRIIPIPHGGQNFTMDYWGEPNMWDDNNGHGTHVAGTIAASLNGNGVAGVAPEVKFLIGKVLNGDGSGTMDSIAKAIKWAADWTLDSQRVRIISMSLGGSGDDPTLHDAVKYAVSKGVVVVCAAGNNGDGSTSTSEYAYPGAYPEVIEVGAIDSQKILARFSNTNSEVDVVAPGVSILSTYNDGGYATLSGTSMATPHVSGAIALLISLYEKRLNKALTVSEIKQLLKEHCQDIGIDGKGEGNGLIDVAKGYTPPLLPSPAPEPVSPPVKSANIIELYIDSIKAYVDGIETILGVAPKIENNLTLVPLRFVGENMGYSVNWDNDTRKITLKKI